MWKNLHKQSKCFFVFLQVNERERTIAGLEDQVVETERKLADMIARCEDETSAQRQKSHLFHFYSASERTRRGSCLWLSKFRAQSQK